MGVRREKKIIHRISNFSNWRKIKPFLSSFFSDFVFSFFIRRLSTLSLASFQIFIPLPKLVFPPSPSCPLENKWNIGINWIRKWNKKRGFTFLQVNLFGQIFVTENNFYLYILWNAKCFLETGNSESCTAIIAIVSVGYNFTWHVCLMTTN